MNHAYAEIRDRSWMLRSLGIGVDIIKGEKGEKPTVHIYNMVGSPKISFRLQISPGAIRALLDYTILLCEWCASTLGEEKKT